MKEEERILTYVLSKEIDREVLEQVSGGAMSMTHSQRIKITGGSGQGTDVIYEHGVDF